jgi:arabinose-5-phosphate isomerase
MENTEKNTKDIDIISELKKALRIEQEAIGEVVAKLDDSTVRAVRMLEECKTSRVILTGIGKAGLIARKIAATLLSTGQPALYVHPSEAVHGDLGIITPDDVALAISNSGETEELIRLLPHLKELGVRIIALTGSPDSTLGRYSDVVLDVGVSREADPLGIAPTASTTAVLAMGDALAGVLLQLRGFTREDFAIFHPGGALGRKLLWRVKDLMHTGEAVPQVQEGATVRQAIYEMTRKRLGTTLVLDSEGKIAGIFTDGDLRRLFQKNPNPLEEKIDDYMTRDPKRTHPEALAAEALRLMESRPVMFLPVVDEEGRPAGALHMHDLVRAGLANYQKISGDSA